MPRPLIDSLIIVALVLVNGLLALSELAIVSARKSRLQRLAERGDGRARAALALGAEPTRFLSTVQIGITLVGIFAGAFGGATLAEPVATALHGFGIGLATSRTLAVVIVVLVITYLSLVLGELVPKRLALQRPEALALLVARPMRIVSRVATPAVTLLALSTDLLLRLFGIRAHQDAPASEDDIQAMIAESTAAGVFLPAEQDLVNRVFRVADRRITELMVPRTEIDWVDVDDPLAAVFGEITASSHTRFPVCEGSLDRVLGTVSVKDIWARVGQDEPIDLRALLRPPTFLPEHLPVLTALERLREAGTELALVVDEYGGVGGLFTVHDAITALMGGLAPAQADDEPLVVERADGSWLVDGMLPSDELKTLVDRASLPGEGDYQTAAGFVLQQLGRIPRAGDYFEWEGLRFEVLDMDGHRIDKLLVIPAP